MTTAAPSSAPFRGSKERDEVDVVGDREATGFALSFLTGSFKEDGPEIRYLRESRAAGLLRLRFVSAVGGAFFLIGFAVDVLLLNGDPVLWWLGGVRLLTAACIAGTALAAGSAIHSRIGFELLTLTALIVVSVATCVIISVSPGPILLHALTAITILLVFYLFVPVSTLTGLVVGLVLTAGFVRVALARDADPPVLTLVILYLTLVNILGTLVVRDSHITRRREFATLEAEREAVADIRAEVKARTAAESALAESEARFRQLVELAPDAVVVHRGARILYSNPAGLRLVGIGMDALEAGASLFDFLDPEYHEPTSERMARLLATGEAVPPVEVVLVTADSRRIWCEVVSGPTVYGGEPAIQTVIRDVAERKRLEQDLMRLATTDPLTGIANRRRFFDQLEVELARARRHGRSLSLIMVDVDHFKQVNDEHGHAVGDTALRALVEAMLEVLRSEDLVARLGGEEFAAILPEVDADGAMAVAERLRSRLGAVGVNAPEGTVRCTVSIGVAQARPAHESPERTLKRADDALYEAKRAGRDRVVLG
jgi:diguanylate cyclase (GGDEF)-like protein/PAS domain S-box-containing protein